MSDKIRVAVLFGGKSNEHAVSRCSGEQVIRHLNPDIYQIKPVYISPEGKWYVISGFILDPSAFSVEQWVEQVTVSGSSDPSDIKNDIDVVFPVLHGKFGEDGSLQAFLEMQGVSYVGSGVLASALALHKIQAKRIYLQTGIPTPPFIEIFRDAWDPKDCAKIKKEIGIPCVIKAPESGSSFDMGISGNIKEAEALIRELFKNHQVLMVEQFVKGKEFSCGVLEDKEHKIPLPPTQIIPKDSSFFDYKAKYETGASEEITPASVSAEMIEALQDLALKAHRVLGCRGYSRTDIMETGGKLFVLETNTLPGMTVTSLIPQQAKAYGMSYPQLLEHLIHQTLQGSV